MPAKQLAFDVEARKALERGVNAVAQAVKVTLGPKGLDCMLLDSLGDVTITNDGSTILGKIEVSHPAAHLLIHAARAQEQHIQDLERELGCGIQRPKY